jgi:putative ubiquitin-RnfH superfamily antitoxin RatB of RatAB toxin-antitoxin module
MAEHEEMAVEVAYARPDVQIIVPLKIGAAATVEAAIRRSGLLERFPEIDLTKNAVGIFGKPCSLAQALRSGERVEIYRPLLADPKEARRHRAANA